MATISHSTKLALYNKAEHEPLTPAEQEEWDEIADWIQFSQSPKGKLMVKFVGLLYTEHALTWEEAKSILATCGSSGRNSTGNHQP